MKNFAIMMALGAIFISCKDDHEHRTERNETEIAENKQQNNNQETSDLPDIKISPISHATAVFKWADKVFYTDPVGGAEAFKNAASPDFILLTDIHGDHLSAETLKSLKLGDTKIVAPAAVAESLPKEFKKNLIILENGESTDLDDFKITAIPMYNLPQSKDAMHVKGRGNGYIIQLNEHSLYISGDTEDIPEMRQLKKIDIALLSMNLPYTMPVEHAADAVLEFKPKKVIPYHYRGKNGFSDIKKFRQLVKEGNSNIEVELMDWYPNGEE
ncbi:MBL fold metallo-hydrolase [Christiangramia aquimixticola]|uniref:MBL fold metallo-hydrolase n=1 Tax=Christiangramia aquimixticola TaxID=1697558 RepID=UPI003AA99875